MMKALKWILITIGVVFSVTLLLITFTIIMLFHAWSNDVEPDFIAYEPKVPLAGWEIVDASQKKGANNGKSRPSFWQAYSSGVVLQQYKDLSPSSPIACEDPPMAHPSHGFQYVQNCKTGAIKNGGEYIVNILYRGEELHTVNVHARLGEVWMYMYIPDESKMQLAEFTEWQSYFDSMQPVDLTAR